MRARPCFRNGYMLAGALLLAGIAILLVIGLSEPTWSNGTYAGGTVPGSGVILLAPFPVMTEVDVFDINARAVGRHLYLLGSDPAGRDLLAMVARASVPSLTLVLLVVMTRTGLGVAMGSMMVMRFQPVAVLSRGVASWTVGLPYLVFAILAVDALALNGRWLAFVVAMSLVGWRDIAEVMVERVEYVRSQSFAEAAEVLGTGPIRFLHLHVAPYLRPALTVEVILQCSSVLVLLAELGYLQVFVGPAIRLNQEGANSVAMPTFPELGQMLGNSRMLLLYRQMAPFLVPASAIALMALGFELLGRGLRARTVGAN